MPTDPHANDLAVLTTALTHLHDWLVQLTHPPGEDADPDAYLKLLLPRTPAERAALATLATDTEQALGNLLMAIQRARQLMRDPERKEPQR